jgi:hypothetical protein
MRQDLSPGDLRQCADELALWQNREPFDVLLRRIMAWEIRRDGWSIALWWTLCQLPWLDSLEMSSWLEREHDRVLTTQRLVAIGLAIEAYSRDGGTVPESLDPLVPMYLAQLPVDPFSGLSFVYRRNDVGYLLYSVGENRRDDGGRPPEGIPIHGGVVDGDLLLPAP